ncbi:MAG: DUF3426 domain-containing protein [Burkholderiales bacterium]|nr:DUF3426 domain-containing protein [Burkholderiales bacterium]
MHTEQLAKRAGQVRCGKCSRIFDALEYLVEETAPPRKSAEVREVAGEASAQALGQQATETAPVVPADVNAEIQKPEIAASAHGASRKSPVQDNAARRSDAVAPESGQSRPDGVEAAAEPDENAFDFGPIAAADTARRTRRWPWLLGALLLLLLLIAQAAYQYRSAVIVLFPEAKPYATELCARLGCDLPLPRRIELMSIEASDLQADTTNPNIMVLSATLKNRAIFDQQLPSLELTLTNAQDQPVVRRVIAPRDYIGSVAGTHAAFATNTEFAIKVFIEGSQVKATGYRLYLFYP